MKQENILNNTNPKSFNKKKMFYVGGGIVSVMLLIIVAVIVSFFLRRDVSEEESEASQNIPTIEIEGATNGYILQKNNIYNYKLKLPSQYLADFVNEAETLGNGEGNFRVEVSMTYKKTGKDGEYYCNDNVDVYDSYPEVARNCGGWCLNWAVLGQKNFKVEEQHIRDGIELEIPNIKLSNFETHSSGEGNKFVKPPSGYNFYDPNTGTFQIRAGADYQYVIAFNIFSIDSFESTEQGIHLRTGNPEDCIEFGGSADDSSNNQYKNLKQDSDLRKFIALESSNDYEITFCDKLNCGDKSKCEEECQRLPFNHYDNSLNSMLVKDKDYYVQIKLPEGVPNNANKRIELAMSEKNIPFCPSLSGSENEQLRYKYEQKILSNMGLNMFNGSDDNRWRAEWGVLTDRIKNNANQGLVDYNTSDDIITLKINFSEFEGANSKFLYDSGLLFQYDISKKDGNGDFNKTNSSFKVTGIDNDGKYVAKQPYILAVNVFNPAGQSDGDKMLYTGTLHDNSKDGQCYTDNTQNVGVEMSNELNKYFIFVDEKDLPAEECMAIQVLEKQESGDWNALDGNILSLNSEKEYQIKPSDEFIKQYSNPNSSLKIKYEYKSENSDNWSSFGEVGIDEGFSFSISNFQNISPNIQYSLYTSYLNPERYNPIQVCERKGGSTCEDCYKWFSIEEPACVGIDIVNSKGDKLEENIQFKSDEIYSLKPFSEFVNKYKDTDVMLDYRYREKGSNDEWKTIAKNVHPLNDGSPPFSFSWKLENIKDGDYELSLSFDQLDNVDFEYCNPVEKNDCSKCNVDFTIGTVSPSSNDECVKNNKFSDDNSLECCNDNAVKFHQYESTSLSCETSGDIYEGYYCLVPGGNNPTIGDGKCDDKYENSCNSPKDCCSCIGEPLQGGDESCVIGTSVNQKCCDGLTRYDYYDPVDQCFIDTFDYFLCLPDKVASNSKVITPRPDHQDNKGDDSPTEPVDGGGGRNFPDAGGDNDMATASASASTDEVDLKKGDGVCNRTYETACNSPDCCVADYQSTGGLYSNYQIGVFENQKCCEDNSTKFRSYNDDDCKEFNSFRCSSTVTSGDGKCETGIENVCNSKDDCEENKPQPSPTNTSCIEQGKQGSGNDTCCDLNNKKLFDYKIQKDTCVKQDTFWCYVNTRCGNGTCDDNESECNCSDDCGSLQPSKSCISEGDTGADKTNDTCCDGLTKAYNYDNNCQKLDTFECHSTIQNLVCGDNKCQFPFENECNCIDCTKISLKGVPQGTDKTTELNISVEGRGVSYYKYKLGEKNNINCSVQNGYKQKNIDQPISDDISNLKDGEILLCVVGGDSAGNWQKYSDATSASWTKDTKAPVANINGQPTGQSGIITLDVSVGGEGVTHYKYKVGELNNINCSVQDDYSSKGIEKNTKIIADISGLSDGGITLCVVGRDSAGNWQTFADATSASWTKYTSCVEHLESGVNSYTDPSMINEECCNGLVEYIYYDYRTGSCREYINKDGGKPFYCVDPNIYNQDQCGDGYCNTAFENVCNCLQDCSIMRPVKPFPPTSPTDCIGTGVQGNDLQKTGCCPGLSKAYDDFTYMGSANDPFDYNQCIVSNLSNDFTCIDCYKGNCDMEKGKNSCSCSGQGVCGKDNRPLPATKPEPTTRLHNGRWNIYFDYVCDVNDLYTPASKYADESRYIDMEYIYSARGRNGESSKDIFRNEVFAFKGAIDSIELSGGFTYEEGKMNYELARPIQSGSNIVFYYGKPSDKDNDKMLVTDNSFIRLNERSVRGDPIQYAQWNPSTALVEKDAIKDNGTPNDKSDDYVDITILYTRDNPDPNTYQQYIDDDRENWGCQGNPQSPVIQ